jgi:molecular chaperone HscB
MTSQITLAEKAPGGAVASCWSCKGPVQVEEFFCSTCQAIQPPGDQDHFSRLGLVVSFDVDEALLDRRYFEQQRFLHPDRFATKTAREKVLSQQQATSLNEAYETLKDPLQRADYLIHLKGRDVLFEGCNLVNDEALLMESLELREALAEAQSVDDVEALEQRADNDIAFCIKELAAVFAANDLDTACRLTTRLKYLRKLAEETHIVKVRMTR